MLAPTAADMKRWMAAINAQINALFIRQYDVPEDDYRSQG